MAMVSLVCCLLALSSVAFGQLSYGSYSYSQPSVRPLPLDRIRVITSKSQPSPIDFIPEAPVPTQNGYGSSYGNQNIPMKGEPLVQFERTFVQPQGYGSGSSMIFSTRGLNTQPSLPPPQISTEADMLCRGQKQGDIIPTHNSRRFVVCLDDGKGAEQHCPRGLFFHPDTQRCERRLGVLADPCARLPCLNGGLCKRVEHTSYKCECPAGFDGNSCELDARICLSQQPCGVSDDVRCQSFRWGAALSYVCIFNGGRGYGLNGQQMNENPCKDDDKIQPLAFTDTGFILCDGERMSVESCPGGTLWDESFDTCVWRDLQSSDRNLVRDQPRQYGYSQYGQTERDLPIPQGYGGQIKIEHPKSINSYGGYQQDMVRDLPKPEPELPKPISSYGGYQQNMVRDLPKPEPELPIPTNSYGGYQQNMVRDLPKPEPEPELPKPISSYGGYQQNMVRDLPKPEPELPRPINSYGGYQQNMVRDLPKPEPELPKPTNSYGGYQQNMVRDLPKPEPELPRPINSYGGYQQNMVRDLPKPEPELPKPINSYGGYQQNIVRDLPKPEPEPELPKPTNSYGGYQQNMVRDLPKPEPEPELPKPTNSYGGYQQNMVRDLPKPEPELPRPTNSYGGYQQQPMPKPQIWQQKMFRAQQPPPQPSSGY